MNKGLRFATGFEDGLKWEHILPLVEFYHDPGLLDYLLVINVSMQIPFFFVS